jgi:hypothetical protein
VQGDGSTSVNSYLATAVWVDEVVPTATAGSATVSARKGLPFTVCDITWAADGKTLEIDVFFDLLSEL